MYQIPRKFTIISFIGLFIVYLIGLIMPDVMEVDAAQYAAISMEMMQTGNYLEVVHLGNNYLDKPPLLFWLGAFFMKLFGVNHFAYRLPTFLITVVGVYATYALGKRLYNKNTGILSALTIASTQVYFLHNHDVRTDTILTNFVIIAIWQGVAYIQTHKTSNFVWAFVAVGLAMLSKGPIGAVVPVMALGTHLLYQRDWKNLFNWRWILGILIVLIVLSPMLWGLYTQYDANPLVQVNGRTGVSGLRFFFWEQSFGRITGENVWKDDSSYFFFTHNYLWEFLPWSIIGIVGFWDKLKAIFLAKFKPTKTLELYTFGGFVFPFIALSTSHYKLPHYIMVIMPLVAIFTAAYLDKLLSNPNKKPFHVIKWIQYGFSVLAGFLVLFILYWVFPGTQAGWWLIPLGIFTFSVFFITKTRPVVKLLAPSLVAIIGINIMLSGYFYPQLNAYQSGRKLADWAVENNISSNQLVMYKKHYFNSYFYSGQNYRWVNTGSLSQITDTGSVYVFTTKSGLNELKANDFTYQIEKRLYNFPNAELTTEFLNPKTRKHSLENLFIVKIEQKP